MNMPACKFINFRLAEINNAEFLFHLRSTQKALKFLSPPPSSLEAQVKWLEDYKIREKAGTDFYFIATDKDIPVGTTRVYNFNDKAFEFGSWLFLNNYSYSSRKKPILAFLATVDWAFQKTHAEYFYTTVKPVNKSMVRFHKVFNAEVIEKLSQLWTTKVSKENFYTAKYRLEK